MPTGYPVEQHNMVGCKTVLYLHEVAGRSSQGIQNVGNYSFSELQTRANVTAAVQSAFLQSWRNFLVTIFCQTMVIIGFSSNCIIEKKQR